MASNNLVDKIYDNDQMMHDDADENNRIDDV